MMLDQNKQFLSRFYGLMARGATIVFTCVYLLSSLSLSTEAQIENSPNRRALFEMAYSNMSFLLHMLNNTTPFSKQLTAEESKMLVEILGIAHEATAINWFKKKNITIFAGQNQYIAAYVIMKNQVIQVTTPEKKIFQLQFSDDQSLFDLDENKNVRTAGTDTALDKDIYINLRRINSKDVQLDFASALSLMIHEFGHKIGPSKNLPAINSMAAKVEQTVRALTRTKTIGDIQVNHLEFKHFPNYDSWVESILYGEYMGVNIPKKPHPLSVFDNQGLYVWTEDKNGINDISDQVRADFKKHATIPYVKDPRYTFVEHDIILASSIEVIPLTEKNSFKIITNGNILRMVIPFLQPNSYHPATYQLYERSFPSAENYTGEIVNYEQDYTQVKDTFQKHQSTQRPLNYKAPAFQGKIVALSLMENEYVIRLQIDADLNYKLRSEQTTATDELWPEIGVLIGSNRIVIPAEKKDADQKNIYEFRIKNFSNLTGGKVSIEDLQFSLKKKYLTVPTANSITRGLLESKALLNPEPPAASPSSKAVFVSAQVLVGNNWETLNSENNKSGQNIRFVFEAKEKFRQFTITQEYNIVHKVHTTMNGEKLPSEGTRFEKQTQEIYFNENQMHQELLGSRLTVELNIDQNVFTNFKFSNNITPEGTNSNLGSINFMPQIIEIFESSVQADRLLHGLKWMSESGGSEKITFEKKLRFNKKDNPIPTNDLHQTSPVKNKIIRCEGMF